MIEELCGSCTHCRVNIQEAPVFCTENMEEEHAHVYCVVRRAFIHPVGVCGDHKSRSEYEEEERKKRLTHEGLVDSCREKAQKHGWSPFSISGIKHEFLLYPDLMLWKRNEKTCALEIKPEVVKRRDIATGIGQCAYYLLYNVDPYLVISEEFLEEVLKLGQYLGWLGIIAYDEYGNLKAIQGKQIF